MNQLKEFREEAGMTVRELSERSGVSEDTITKIENGHRKGRSMTLRKLAKALGVRPYLLSPEHFERAGEAEDRAPDIITRHNSFSFEAAGAHPPMTEVVQDADILEEAVARVYEVMRAIDRPVEKSPPQRRDSDAVPRVDISERQQKVLATVLECGEVGPSTVADRLEISISTAYRDLSVLGEHGLVMADDSGKRLISPLGRDLVEAIVNTRDKLSLDEALSHIASLMKVYESVFRFDPHRATSGSAASFYRLQELIIQSIRRIAVVTEPPRLASQVQQNLWAGKAEQKDAAAYAQAVQSVRRLLMSNPPALSHIHEDLEGVTEEQIRETVGGVGDTVVGGHESVEAYKQFLLETLKVDPLFTLPYGIVQRDEADSAQNATMRDAD